MEPPKRPSVPASPGTFWPLVQNAGRITYQITCFVARTVQKIVLIAYHLIASLFVSRPSATPAPPTPPPLPLPAPAVAAPLPPPPGAAAVPPPSVNSSPPVPRAIVLSPAFEELRTTINQIIQQLSDDVVTVNVAPLLEPLQKIEPKALAGKVIDVLNAELEAQGNAERSTPYASAVATTDPNSIRSMYEMGYKEYLTQLTQKVYAQARLKNQSEQAALAQAEQERKNYPEKPLSDLQEDCRTLYLSQIRTEAYIRQGKIGPVSKALGQNLQAVDRELLCQEHLKKFSDQLLDSTPKIKQYAAPHLAKILQSLVEPQTFLELVLQHLLPVIRNGLLKALIVAVAKKNWDHIGPFFYNYNVCPIEQKAVYFKQICTEIAQPLTKSLGHLVKMEYLQDLIKEIVEAHHKEGTLLIEAMINNSSSSAFTVLAHPFTLLHNPATAEEDKRNAYIAIQQAVLGLIPHYRQLIDPNQFKNLRENFNKQCDLVVDRLVADMRLRLKPPAAITDKSILEALRAALNQDAFTQDDSLSSKLLSTAFNAGAAFSPKVGGMINWAYGWLGKYAPSTQGPLKGLIAPSINRIVEPFLGSADQLARLCNAYLIETFYTSDRRINLEKVTVLLSSKSLSEKLTPYQASLAFDKDLKDLATIAYALCQTVSIGTARALVDADDIFRKLKTIFHAFIDHKMINFARVEALVNALKK